MNLPKVTAVAVTHGARWNFLSQVVGSVVNDPHILKLIIVDNNSKNKKEIEQEAKKYGDKIVLLPQEENLGSAAGFAIGLEYARKTDCDYVFILDDDSVPEEGAIFKFLNVLSIFPDKKVILSGNRVNIPGNQEFFYTSTLKNDSPRGTFFEVFSSSKILYFLQLLMSKYNKKKVRGPFVPIAPTEAFVFGGSFLPIEAVREAPLPDRTLGLYGDDVEYSWNIKKLGYSSYLCFSPVIYDVEVSFSNESYVFSLFSKDLPLYRVYYRIRNMVRLSVRHSSQKKIILFFNIIVWIIGLSILGFFRKGGLSFSYLKRIKIIFQAAHSGYFPEKNIPEEVRLPA